MHYVYYAYNFQLNYNYTTKIRQICSGVIFVHIDSLIVNWEYVCMPDANMAPSRRVNILSFLTPFLYHYSAKIFKYLELLFSECNVTKLNTRKAIHIYLKICGGTYPIIMC